jgi:predicted glutamine amidotransferase
MCGIVYAFRKDGKPARKRIMKRYTKQKARGSDGYGYVALNKEHGLAEYHRSMEESEVREAITKQTAAHILFHHRYPTSTNNLPEAAHPIEVRHKELEHTYYVVHNGVIRNPDELKEEHEALGYEYSTVISTEYVAKNGQRYYGAEEYNDSEALAIELARTIEGLQPKVRAEGTIATMVLQMDKAGTQALALYFGTNGGNPLTVTEDETALVIASEGGKAIPGNIMYRTDFVTHETETVNVPLVSYEPPKLVNYAQYSGYNYGKQGAIDFDDETGEADGVYATETGYDPELDDADPWGYTLDELEEHALDTRGDIEIARAAGEVDERIGLEIELQGIEEQIAEHRKRLGMDDEDVTEDEKARTRIGYGYHI